MEMADLRPLAARLQCAVDEPEVEPQAMISKSPSASPSGSALGISMRDCGHFRGAIRTMFSWFSGS